MLQVVYLIAAETPACAHYYSKTICKFRAGNRTEFFMAVNYYCAKKTKAIPSHSVISTETNEVSEAEKSQNKNTLFKRFFDFACGSAQNDRR